MGVEGPGENIAKAPDSPVSSGGKVNRPNNPRNLMLESTAALASRWRPLCPTQSEHLNNSERQELYAFTF